MKRWTAAVAGWTTCGALTAVAAAQGQRLPHSPRFTPHERPADRITVPRGPADPGPQRGRELARPPRHAGPGADPGRPGGLGRPGGPDLEHSPHPAPGTPRCDCPCRGPRTDRPAAHPHRRQMAPNPAAHDRLAPPQPPAIQREQGRRIHRAGPPQHPPRPAPSADRPQPDRQFPPSDRPGVDRRSRGNHHPRPDRPGRFSEREPAQGPPTPPAPPDAAAPDATAPDVAAPDAGATPPPVRPPSRLPARPSAHPPARQMRTPPQTL